MKHLFVFILSCLFSVSILAQFGSHSYTLELKSGRKLLTGESISLKRNGTKVIMMKKGNGLNQRWKIVEVENDFYKVVNVGNGKCLDAFSNKVNENGCGIQLWDCSNQKNQLWALIPLGDGNYYILNKASINGNIDECRRAYRNNQWLDNCGKSLDAWADYVNEDGCGVQLWNIANQSNQKWKINKSL